MNKLRILMCSEASFISSGFGTYTKEILSRLYKTNKYTIAEFASYGMVNDSRDKSIDWTYYANAVNAGDSRHAEYNSRADNQFGRWRFEKVLLDFKPDVVIDIRDYWMSAYQKDSPLRKFFHWILMPTVDSEPQQEDWIDTYLSADAIFTYSDWGADVLRRQSSNNINYIDTTSPGVDLSVFNIKDKKHTRSIFNLPEDYIIIGSVMRNQKRKLIPELFASFRKLLDKIEASQPDLGKKLFLYLHTSFPDQGWDIPEILKDNRISNKVLFSYICKHCGNVHCDVFSGPVKSCPKCAEKLAVFPSVSQGVSSEKLSEIYNLFDMYVQYSICEGFGMPQVEAGACGIPIMTVEYSAMCDVIKKLNAYPIKIKARFKEMETKAIRVYPDNDSLIEHILSFINTPKKFQDSKRKEVRDLTEKHYDWDKISNKWEKYLDSIPFRSNWGNTNPPLNTIDINDEKNKPNNKDYFDHMITMCSSYLNNTSEAGSMTYLNMLRDVDYGFSIQGSIREANYIEIINRINTVISNSNAAHTFLSKNIELQDDFIIYARMKDQK